MFRRGKNDLSPERRAFLRRTAREKYAVNAVRFLILFLIFALWEIAGQYGWIDPFIMSMPSRMLETFLSLLRDGSLFRHVGISCLETVIGFVLGTVVGSLIAMLLWWSKFASRVMEPYLVVLSALPKIALGPIFIVWAGAGMKAIVVMTLAIALVVTVLDVLNGFLSTDAEKIKLVRSFGATRLQIFTKVVLPYNIPTFIGALKINVGLSWIGVIMGEFLVSKAGIGYLIVYGSQVFRMDLVMTGVLILTVPAALMYIGVQALEKHLLKHL